MPKIFLTVLLLLIVSILLLPNLGDKLIEGDHITQAQTVYTLAQKITPFRDFSQRLLATKVLLADRQIPNGEADGDSPALNSKVLGVSAITVPVLMYHYIRVNPDPNDIVGAGLSVTPYDFAAQMNYLDSHGYHTITLDQMAEGVAGKIQLPTKPIVITFDDGYRDCYMAAFPILKQHRFVATNFIITGLVGGPSYLTWEQIKEMSDSGVISIEDHTIHHVALTYSSDQGAIHEILDAKKTLEEHIGKKVSWFAYPLGNVDQRIAGIVKSLGFSGAFGTNTGTFQADQEIFTRPRVRMAGSVNYIASVLPWK